MIPVAVLVALTAAPETTAPLESWIVPTRLPFSY